MSLPVLPSAMWDADLPRANSELRLALDLEAWIESDALRVLAAAWGGSVPRKDQNQLALFEWFDDFSREHWDFRGGQERSFTAVSKLTSFQLEACQKSATAFGMVEGPQPSRRAYDYVLILGGLARACITRTQYVSGLVERGTKLGEVVALGGSRPLGEDEMEFVRSRGLDARSEFEAMLAGTKLAFGLTGRPAILESSPRRHAFSDWALAKFTGPWPISVVAAPSTSPEHRRANTADTFAWWAEREGALTGKHLLVVTTPIYVPYQSAVAVENLGIPFNASIETVGVAFETSGLGDLRPLFSPENYLQEIRSAIRGYRSLYEKLLSIRIDS